MKTGQTVQISAFGRFGRFVRTALLPALYADWFGRFGRFGRFVQQGATSPAGGDCHAGSLRGKPPRPPITYGSNGHVVSNTDASRQNTAGVSTTSHLAGLDGFCRDGYAPAPCVTCRGCRVYECG